MHARLQAAVPAGLRWAALLAFGLALAGCADPWRPGSGLRLTEPDPPKTVAHYCYRTLAEVECYRTPLPDAAGRRVGWVDLAEQDQN